MEPIERLLITQACEALIYRYCHLIDHGEAGRVGELFAEDGAWVTAEATRSGRAAVAKAFKARQDNTARISRHVCSTPLVEPEGPDLARAVTYVTLYRHDGEPGRATAPLDGLPEIVGEYRDELVRTPDGWRFRRREFVSVFVRKRNAANG